MFGSCTFFILALHVYNLNNGTELQQKILNYIINYFNKCFENSVLTHLTFNK